MHSTCYMVWDRRSEFASLYSAAKRRWYASNPNCSLLLDTPNLFVVYWSLSPAVIIFLKQIAVAVSVELEDLNYWLLLPTADERFVQAELDRVRADLNLIGGKDHILEFLRSSGLADLSLTASPFPSAKSTSS